MNLKKVVLFVLAIVAVAILYGVVTGQGAEMGRIVGSILDTITSALDSIIAFIKSLF